eukprot:m.274338 g.274338  ORF g.274338 m.274338 type:complete len:63 (-) comp15686_c1_seq25:97-285(-)
MHACSRGKYRGVCDDCRKRLSCERVDVFDVFDVCDVFDVLCVRSFLVLIQAFSYSCCLHFYT